MGGQDQIQELFNRRDFFIAIFSNDQNSVKLDLLERHIFQERMFIFPADFFREFRLL